MGRRYLIAIPFALLVAFALFGVMQWLIISGEAKFKDEKSFRMIDFVRVRRAAQVETKERELPQKVEKTKAPESPDISHSQSGGAGAIAVSVSAPEIDTSGLRTGPRFNQAIASDTDIVPLVRVNPAYPPQAAERKIEGWVIVEFTISARGSVEDAEVIAAQPPGVFDTAAIRAIRKWKYKPKIENGEPVERTGVQVRLTFELEKNDNG